MRRPRLIIVLISIAALIGVIGCALTGVYTNNNNNARTGVYSEKVLNPGNVNAGAMKSFGKLHTWDVEGQIYAQPLYVRGLGLSDGRTHNVVYVATEKNWVYAFEADSPHATLWVSPLGPPVPWAETVCGPPPFVELFGRNIKNLYPYIGITSTPVIDPDTKTMYVVTYSKEENGYVHKLHALDLRNGQEKFGGPVAIMASVPGPGYDNQGGVIVFNSGRQLNRPGLLFWNGLLYIAFGSFCDSDPYHGWILSYDAQTLQQKSVYNTTPGGGRGAIWQSGRGLVADGRGNVFFMTGNGEVHVDTHSINLGHSFVRLQSDLKFPDWFTPRKHACRNQYDLDLGASGPLLITAQSGALADNRIVGGGKDGSFYLLNAMDMGKAQDQGHEPLHEIIATHEPEWFGFACNAAVKTGGRDVHHIHGGPVLWDKFNDGRELLVYLLGENDQLKVFKVEYDRILGPLATSKFCAPPGMPGGTLSLSYSEDPSNALIWVNIPLKSDAVEHIVEGILIAFQALPQQAPAEPNQCTSTPSTPYDLPLLWHSEMFASRDSVGLYAKFVPPTIADGKVFVASFGDPKIKDDRTRKGWLHVYGLSPPPQCQPRTTCSIDAVCGETESDGCGGTLACTRCERGFTCEGNICEDCVVVCDKRHSECLDVPNPPPAQHQMCNLERMTCMRTCGH